MFGMLDYRARKLFVLLSLPISICVYLISWGVVAVPIIIIPNYSWNPLVKVAVAFVGIFLLNFLLLMLCKIIDEIFCFCFFWLVDIEPCHTENVEEARFFVRSPKFLLNKKVALSPLGWTREDTENYLKFFNWKTRLFVNVRKHIEEQIELRKEQFRENPSIYDYDRKYYMKDGLTFNLSGKEIALVFLFSRDCFVFLILCYVFIFLP